jgi:hypothetical protein
MRLMSEKQEKKPLHPETFFLPPLKMVLTFFEKESHQNEQAAKAENQEKATEQDVEKLIEKLSEKEE